MSDDVSAWLGKTEQREDRLEPARANALLAALGRPQPLGEGDVLPTLFHWLYFWEVQPPSHTDEDGHPKRGGFLPPVALPRRMWAGGELHFHAPLRLGDTVTRTSRISAIETKHGRSGRLVFVTVTHTLSGPVGEAISERQDIVYREASAAMTPAATSPEMPLPAPETARLTPGEVLLFRYSALTMNSHRIHYDRPYAACEGYPDLVVHGPLQATLLAHCAESTQLAPLRHFQFRGIAPAFAGAPLSLCRDGPRVWAEQNGSITMQAEVSV